MREEAVDRRAVAFDPQEADLVERAKARLPEAWTEIYSRNYRLVYRYVHARVFEKETAEDLTSAVFVAAIKGIDSYKYRGTPLLGWLYRIARNTVSSHQREMLGPRMAGASALEMPRRVITRFMRRAQPLPEESHDIGGGAGEPGSLIERLALKDALGHLTSLQREVVILRFFVGLNTQEIASAIEKDTPAVYSLEARALGALRRQMAES